MQNDFIEGGALGVQGGGKATRSLAEAIYLNMHNGMFIFPDIIITTQDWHINPGNHWSDSPDFVDSWPVHCEAGTDGAEIHRELSDAIQRRIEDDGATYLPFIKGEYQASYSGFDGRLKDSDDNRTLAQVLRDLNVDSVEIVGLATDHCVKATALDAINAGFRTYILTDFIAGVDKQRSNDAMVEMSAAGVVVV